MIEKKTMFHKVISKKSFLILLLFMIVTPVLLQTNFISDAATAKKGFVKEKDGTHYYKDGKTAKGRWTIHGKIYIFNKNGVMLKSTWYTTKKGNKYYLKKDGTAAVGKTKIKGKTYIFTKGGRMKKGLCIDPLTGKKYYTGTKSGVVKTGWKTVKKGTRMYFGKNGAAYIGKHKIKNTWYYFKSNGAVYTGKFKIGNCLYYANSKGAIYRTVDGSKKMVALTFDDGPSAYTPIVLDTLEKYDAVATFFVVGNRVSGYRSYVERAYNMGCEIGTHTYDHAWLDQLSASEIKKEIQKGSDAIVKSIGIAPTLMRPPGGCVNSTVKSNVGLPMILWSVDTRDWETRSTSTTISRVVNGAYDGAIILVHDLHQSTAIASKTFIPKLIANGYQLVTVSEMAELRGIKMKAGQMYYSFPK